MNHGQIEEVPVSWDVCEASSSSSRASIEEGQVRHQPRADAQDEEIINKS